MAVPLRTCVGCRQVVASSELVRFVLVDGSLRRDVGGGAPGRGAWLHPDRTCLAAARSRRGFARSFRRTVNDQALGEFAESLPT